MFSTCQVPDVCPAILPFRIETLTRQITLENERQLSLKITAIADLGHSGVQKGIAIGIGMAIRFNNVYKRQQSSISLLRHAGMSEVWRCGLRIRPNRNRKIESG